jgi:hypothetical protein
LPSLSRPYQRSMSQMLMTKRAINGMQRKDIGEEIPKLPSRLCARCCLLKALSDSTKRRRANPESDVSVASHISFALGTLLVGYNSHTGELFAS